MSERRNTLVSTHSSRVKKRGHEVERNRGEKERETERDGSEKDSNNRMRETNKAGQTTAN